jgi:Tol biopolymer transport system component
VVAGAVAVVLAAGGVTGWLAFRPDEKKKPTGTAPTGAATALAFLPDDPLVVRIDRRLGWPGTCYGSVGTLAPDKATATSVLKRTDTCDILPRWSPDRRRIAFTRSTGIAHNELWVMNADGTVPYPVTPVEGRSRVAWSPDMKQIAIVAKVDGHRQIEVYPLSGRQSPLVLTDDDSEKDDPAWCGNRVAFWSTKTGTQQIYTVDARTPHGTWTQVTHESHDVNDPAFSPTCTQMAYTDQPTGQPADANRHIWLTDADGTGRPRQLTSNDTRDMDATYSPDGTWIAVTRGLTPKPSIWAIRLSDGHQQMISPAGKHVAHPDWS